MCMVVNTMPSEPVPIWTPFDFCLIANLKVTLRGRKRPVALARREVPRRDMSGNIFLIREGYRCAMSHPPKYTGSIRSVTLLWQL